MFVLFFLAVTSISRNDVVKVCVFVRTLFISLVSFLGVFGSFWVFLGVFLVVLGVFGCFWVFLGVFGWFWGVFGYF